jgi:hypothetical protein
VACRCGSFDIDVRLLKERANHVDDIFTCGGSIFGDWHCVGFLHHKGHASKTMGRRVNASFCDSDFLRGNRFSRLATCCGSRGNANNVIARLGTDTIIDPATRWRGEAINFNYWY